MSMSWQNVEHAPAILVRPPAAVSLDDAWEAIELWEHYTGKTLDPEQRLMVEVMMAHRSGGYWAAQTTGIEDPRQNGKGDACEVVELHGAVMRGEAIGHTAHEIPTVSKAYERMLGVIDGNRDLRRRLLKTLAGKGQQMLSFKGGGQIDYRTRTAGGMRGLDDLSRLVVDEAQHATPEQIASSRPTLSVAPNPQTNYFGTGSIRNRNTNHSEQWWRQRIRALRAMAGFVAPGAFGYIGFTAERVEVMEDGSVVQVSPDADDMTWWLMVNHAAKSGRISVEFLEEALRDMGAAMFLREHGCVWDPPPVLDVTSDHPIVSDWWNRQADESSQMVGQIALAVDVGFDMDRAAIGAAGRRPDGQTHVELIETTGGTEWVEGRLARYLARHPVALVGVDASGPARALVPMLERVCAAHKVKLSKLSTVQFSAGAKSLANGVESGWVWHGGDSLLTVQATTAVKRLLSDGATWVWDRRVGEVSALAAVTVAAYILGGVDSEGVWSAYEDDTDPGDGAPSAIRSAYEDDEALFV